MKATTTTTATMKATTTATMKAATTTAKMKATTTTRMKATTTTATMKVTITTATLWFSLTRRNNLYGASNRTKRSRPWRWPLRGESRPRAPRPGAGADWELDGRRGLEGAGLVRAAGISVDGSLCMG